MARRQEMNKTYLITLTPTGKFFFGGDMTFEVKSKNPDSKDADEAFNSMFSSYIIRSAKFPQQTSLLGMLRFLILRNEPTVFDDKTQTITNRSEAGKLIGERSFQNKNEVNDFGKIKALSPCFLQKEYEQGKWGDLVRSAKDDNLDINLTSFTSSIVNGRAVYLPTIEYNPKKEYKVTYKLDSPKMVMDEEGIFKEDICNGINRDIVTGKVDEDAYFKQVFYRFDDGYRFAFYAEIDCDKLDGYSGQLVSVGGDNSQFVIGIKEVSAPLEQKPNGTRVVLSSPAYLTMDNLKSVSFAISDTVPFKCMRTETASVTAYNKRNQRYGYIEGLTLYDRGSVFFFAEEKDAKEFFDILKRHADFYQIGYNHIQLETNNTKDNE